MTADELNTILKNLRLDSKDAAQLLEVSPRTVRRWMDAPAEIPGPTCRALQAWSSLERAGLPWRPDEGALATSDAAQIARYRDHAIELYELLERVEKRGGPSIPWNVNLVAKRASLGPVQVSFYELANGGFSLQSLRRSDQAFDSVRDLPLLEDAIASIATAFARRQGRRFVFEVTLQDDVVLLWDVQQAPTTVMKLACTLVRSTLAEQEQLTNEQCRLLAACNKELLAEVAESLFAQRRYAAREDGIRVINVVANDLKPIASRFLSTALAVTPYWVMDGGGRGRSTADYAVIPMSGGEFGVRLISAKAQQRTPKGLKVGYTKVFKSRSDARRYVDASEREGFSVVGKDLLERGGVG